MFVSLCYVVIDPAAEELRYSNAGHPHAWVFRSDGVSERLVATDPPVGFAGPESYAEARVLLARMETSSSSSPMACPTRSQRPSRGAARPRSSMW